MKFRKGFMAVVLAIAVVFTAIPAYAADHSKSADEMTMREKVWNALGREPDCYVLLLEDGSVEVTEDEFYTIADELKSSTFDDTKYVQRLEPMQSFEKAALHEEYYDFSTHSVSPRAKVTETITPHTINARTTMWYGNGYYMNKEGLLTFEITFSATPTSAYSVLKQDGTQTSNSHKINTDDYATAYIASSAGTYNPGVKNSASASISVTGGEINCIA